MHTLVEREQTRACSTPPKKKKKRTKLEHIIFFGDKLEIDLYSKLNKNE